MVMSPNETNTYGRWIYTMSCQKNSKITYLKINSQIEGYNGK